MVSVEVFDRMEQCTEAEVQRLLPLVNAQRREQALQYKHLLGQFCCLKSWLMLQQLTEQCGYNRIQEYFRYNPNGKPFWENGPYFSISHCKAGIAVALSDTPVGIDVETIRHADEDLIKRTMNAAERELIQTDRDFIRLWTKKEAAVKAQGTGIQSFEQLQTILEKEKWKWETIEKENYIYSIAYE